MGSWNLTLKGSRTHPGHRNAFSKLNLSQGGRKEAILAPLWEPLGPLNQAIWWSVLASSSHVKQTRVWFCQASVSPSFLSYLRNVQAVSTVTRVTQFALSLFLVGPCCPLYVPFYISHLSCFPLRHFLLRVALLRTDFLLPAQLHPLCSPTHPASAATLVLILPECRLLMLYGCTSVGRSNVCVCVGEGRVLGFSTLHGEKTIFMLWGNHIIEAGRVWLPGSLPPGGPNSPNSLPGRCPDLLLFKLPYRRCQYENVRSFVSSLIKIFLVWVRGTISLGGQYFWDTNVLSYILQYSLLLITY